MNIVIILNVIIIEITILVVNGTEMAGFIDHFKIIKLSCLKMTKRRFKI